MLKKIAAAALPLVFLSSAALAQITVVSPYTDLSPGDQRIANALYQGELRSPLTGLKPLSLDDIALAKQSGDGWGEVFKSMQSQGFVGAKNLGQLVSGHAVAPTPVHAPIAITLANGRTIFSSGGHGDVNLAESPSGAAVTHGGGRSSGAGAEGHASHGTRGGGHSH